VHRYLTLFGLQPHRSKAFKLLTDPFFIEKVRDVVGLYLNAQVADEYEDAANEEHDGLISVNHG